MRKENQIRDFFLKINKINISEVKHNLQWLHSLAVNKKQEPNNNNDIIRRILLANKVLFKDVMKEAKGLLSASFQNNATSFQIMRFFDLYSIPYVVGLGENPSAAKMQKLIPIKPNVCSLTAFIQLSNENMLELARDFYKYLNLNPSRLSIELGFTRTYITQRESKNLGMNENAFYALCFRYRLHDINFEAFIDYCDLKGWINKQELYKNQDFIVLLNQINSFLNKEPYIKGSKEFTKQVEEQIGIFIDFTKFKKSYSFLDDSLVDKFKDYSKTVMRVEDNCLNPFIQEGDAVILILADKPINETGFYLVEYEGKELFTFIQFNKHVDYAIVFASLDSKKIQILDFEDVEIIGFVSRIFTISDRDPIELISEKFKENIL